MKVGDLVRYLRPNDGEPFDDTLGIVVAHDIVQPSPWPVEVVWMCDLNQSWQEPLRYASSSLKVVNESR